MSQIKALVHSPQMSQLRCCKFRYGQNKTGCLYGLQHSGCPNTALYFPRTVSGTRRTACHNNLPKSTLLITSRYSVAIRMHWVMQLHLHVTLYFIYDIKALCHTCTRICISLSNGSHMQLALQIS